MGNDMKNTRIISTDIFHTMNRQESKQVPMIPKQKCPASFEKS